MIIPGVQKPHWRPCWSQNACWRGWSVAPSARPSIVLISEPWAWTASIVQDLALRPSTWTVHAPQLLVSQPTCVPVSPKTSRRRWTRSSRGSTSASRASPLTVTVMCWVVIVAPCSRVGQRPDERLAERAEGQLGDHRALVLDGSADVGGRVAHRRGGRADGAEELLGRRRVREHRLGVGRRERRA